MEDVNKRRLIFLSLSELEFSLQLSTAPAIVFQGTGCKILCKFKQMSNNLQPWWDLNLFAILVCPSKVVSSQTLMRGITALRSTIVSDRWYSCDIKIVIDITHLKHEYLLIWIGSTWNKPHPYYTRLCFKKNWKEAQCSEPVKSRVPS